MSADVTMLQTVDSILDDDLFYLARDPDNLAPGDDIDRSVRGDLLRGSPRLGQRLLTLTNGAAQAWVTLWAFGTEAQLQALTVTQIAGSAIEVSDVPAGLLLHSIFVSYEPNFNTGTSWTFRYPEPFGRQTIDQMMFPELRQWNAGDPAVMQPLTLINCSNDGGVVQIQKGGLVAGQAARWKLQVL